jgi:hypothetical protein
MEKNDLSVLPQARNPRFKVEGQGFPRHIIIDFLSSKVKKMLDQSVDEEKNDN